MDIQILWHRHWLNFAISGLCKSDGELYWFRWDGDKNYYLAFGLSEEQLEHVDQERDILEKNVGKIIYHDERYEPVLALAEGTPLSGIPLAKLTFEKESFIFSKSDVSNPIPHGRY
jgi:hypothetical protein